MFLKGFLDIFSFFFDFGEFYGIFSKGFVDGDSCLNKDQVSK